jgi:hypothetical protein
VLANWAAAERDNWQRPLAQGPRVRVHTGLLIGPSAEPNSLNCFGVSVDVHAEAISPEYGQCGQMPLSVNTDVNAL